jgi:hypothetical protein
LIDFLGKEWMFNKTKIGEIVELLEVFGLGDNIIPLYKTCAGSAAVGPVVFIISSPHNCTLYVLVPLKVESI